MQIEKPGTNDTASMQPGPIPGPELHLALMFALVFAVVAAYPLLSGQAPRTWAAAVAIAFTLLGLVKPSLLGPLNRAWFRLGLWLHAVVNPLVMALIYCTAVIPTGLMMRWIGRDPMNRKYQRTSGSYWIVRDPPGPSVDGLKNQF